MREKNSSAIHPQNGFHTGASFPQFLEVAIEAAPEKEDEMARAQPGRSPNALLLTLPP